jgi:thymidylate synthase
MTRFVVEDLRNGYVQLASHVLDRGYRVVTRDLVTTELTSVTVEVPEPTGVMLPIHVNRRVNARLAAVEALQLLSGTCDGELLLRASPGYGEVLIRPENVAYGAYGPRLRHQLDAAYHELRRDPTSRRVVLTIHREDDLTHDGDHPCTLSAQLLVRRGRLELIVNMRSWDLWLGVPYDVFMWSQLQRSFAHQLGVDVGRYVHHTGSLHVYERDLESVGMLTRCRDDRPAPVDYPLGVVAPAGDLTDVAARLLTGDVEAHEAVANPWYVRQLAALGVSGRTT